MVEFNHLAVYDCKSWRTNEKERLDDNVSCLGQLMDSRLDGVFWAAG